MNNEPTVHVAARVSADLAAAFRDVAARSDRTMSQELRHLIRQHVSRPQNDDDPAANTGSFAKSSAVQERRHGQS